MHLLEVESSELEVRPPGFNLSLEDANQDCGLVLTPHPALSPAFAKASARRPRRGYPSVACLKV